MRRNELIEYIRDKHGHKRGVLVAWKEYEEQTFSTPEPILKFGWSLCHRRLDKFDRETGLFLARGRAVSDASIEDIPNSIADHADSFLHRSCRYFGKNEPTSICLSPAQFQALYGRG